MYHLQPCQLWCETWSYLSCRFGFSMKFASNKFVGALIPLQVTHIVIVWCILREADTNLGWRGSFAYKPWSIYFYIYCLGWWLRCTLRASRRLYVSNFGFSSWMTIGGFKDKQHLHHVIINCSLPCQKNCTFVWIFFCNETCPYNHNSKTSKNPTPPPSTPPPTMNYVDYWVYMANKPNT